MNRPKPVDPLGYRPYTKLRLFCICGHMAIVVTGEIARRHRLSASMKVYEMLQRLRCSRCRRRGCPGVSLA